MALRHTLKRNRPAPNRQMKFDLTSKYCRKFCRTGFCPRGPSCHFAHDPSKIAICSSFIYGKCIKPNCLLSHNKTSDNMPDCLFFQKGFCRTENCCYRHVKVGDNAQPCQDFIKGVCLLGLQCQNTHLFECRTLKKTGHCPKSSKCNFYHPKHTTKSREKRTNLKLQPEREKYKKINPTSTSSTAISSSSSIEKEKLSHKKLLNLLLEKRLKSPIKPNPIISPSIVKSFENGSDFISLSTDVSTDSSNNILNLTQEKPESKFNSQTSGGKKKYFITDNDEDKISDYVSANALLSSEQTCRPRLKIVPDFLLATE